MMRIDKDTKMILESKDSVQANVDDAMEHLKVCTEALEQNPENEQLIQEQKDAVLLAAIHKVRLCFQDSQWEFKLRGQR